MLTFASITEPDPFPWFKRTATAGRILMAVWMSASLALNLAFGSNLRAVLLRPVTEKPINTLQDAFDRGTNLWIPHQVPDETRPDIISQHFLNVRINPAIKQHFEMKNHYTTYPLTPFEVMPQSVKEDVFEIFETFEKFTNLKKLNGQNEPPLTPIPAKNCSTWASANPIAAFTLQR